MTVVSPHPPQTPTRSRGVQISDWKLIERNTLIGVFNAHLPSGMIIVGCMVHRNPGGDPWIALPGAAQIERDGTPKRSGDGKVLYKTTFKFESNEIYKKFQAPILEELRQLGHI